MSRAHPVRAREVRRQLAGADAIARALDRGVPLQRVVYRRGADDAALTALVERARAAGIPVSPVSARQLSRLAPRGARCDALALAGPPRASTRSAVLADPGAVWLLAGVEYPGNAGFAIRTAEVSGAAGVFVAAPFDHAGRRETVRAAMRADRFVPVFWEETRTVLDDARAHGRRVIGIEDVGDVPPWETDLTGPVLFVVGGEAHGVPEAALDRCDAIVRLPMAGFVRSYNLQAAVAAVACERLRQLAGGPR